MNDATDARNRRAAGLLVDARNRRVPLRELPQDARPQSSDDAYAIQDLVIGAIGPAGGWKVGAKTPTAEPTCAPLPAARIHDEPQRIRAGMFRLNGIEAELAFTLARALPPRDVPYAAADLRDAIATVHPVIEIVDSRYVDLERMDTLSLLADSFSNGALVVGRGIPLPRSFAVDAQPVEVDIDGERALALVDSNPAGDPMRLLAWLANHAARRCGGLRQGDVVTTGSWTGVRFLPQGGRVVARFPRIGTVALEFLPASP
jgi:2-keto-4-pentenoate hydratase